MTQTKDWNAWKNYIFTASRILTGAEMQLHKAHKLSLSDYDVMVTLLHAPEHTLSVSCLKATVVVTTSGLSRAIGRLEQRGWLTKTPDECDKRQITLQLTAEGIAAIEAIRPDHHQYASEHFFNALTAEEQKSLREILARLREHLTD